MSACVRTNDVNEYPGVLRYLLIGQTWTPCIANFSINLFTGWLAFRKDTFVEIWKSQHGAVADLMGTSFFLPLITCLVAGHLIHRKRSAGQLHVTELSRSPAWLRLLPKNLWLRAAVWGCLSLSGCCVPILAGFATVSASRISLEAFLTSKVLFAVMLGMLVTPIVVLAELYLPAVSAEGQA